jgi:DNA-binding SARP family transcriptional activator
MGPDDRQDDVEFLILGSFECLVGGAPIKLRGPLQERLAVYLMLSRGRVVPVSRLVEAVWDDDGPDTASHQVRKMISDIRSRVPALGALLTTSSAGYQLELSDDQLDLARFQSYQARAQAALAQGGRDQAVVCLRRALELWRGPLLQGDGSPVVNAASVALQDARASMLEQMFDIRLACGESMELMAELHEAVAEHPLHERLCGQLMLALNAAGRQAEALQEFQRMRRLLCDQHGISPGSDLRALHERILRDDPALLPSTLAGGHVDAHAAAGADVESPSRFEAPNTLPYALPDFTGRDDELATVFSASGDPRSPDSGLRIVVIDGMGGCGKSALAVHAAHSMRDRYPDGQLCLDLQGFTPGAQPLPPHEALGIALSVIGLPGHAIPGDITSRTCLWRARTAERRMLILLDNATGAEQVLPLIPNSPSSLVMITSRNRIADLDGARNVSLGVFSPATSQALLERILGRERVAAEPEASARLARLCGELPLALRISASRLLHRSHWTIARLADRLEDDARKLHELDFAERSVAASILSSYEALEPRHRLALRQLSTHPGENIDTHAACAALGLGLDDTEDVLDALLDRHLIEHHAHDRFTIHDLVRAAISPTPSPAGGSDSDGDEARNRLTDYYARASSAACDVVFPGRPQLWHLPTYQGPLPPVERLDAAVAWLDAEHRTQIALLGTVHSRSRPGGAFHIARNLSFYFHRRGLSEFLCRTSEVAVEAARALDDEAILHVALINLAVARNQHGRTDEAIGLLTEALGSARRGGDQANEATCLNRLGAYRRARGHNVRARECLEQAIPLHHLLGQRREEALARTTLCALYLDLGLFPAAVEQARRAEDLSRVLGMHDQWDIARANLGYSLLRCGKAAMALETLTAALTASSPMFCDSSHAALLLANLALAHLQAGHPAMASLYADRAGDVILTSTSAPAIAVTVLNRLGHVYCSLGDITAARDRHAAALRLAEHTGYRIGKARALAGLAGCRACGEHTGINELSAQASILFDDLEVPDCARAPY